MIAKNPDDPSTELGPPAGDENGEISDSDLNDVPDGTLGGYFREHNRPPAFEGPDGEPYTVSPEAERTPDLTAPWEGYLVFPRWAHSGLGVVGHVETHTLLRGKSRDDVLRQLGRTPLSRVRELLAEAVRRREAGS